jgi:hypothetical protein
MPCDEHDIRAILLLCPNLLEMSTALQIETLLRSDIPRYAK